MREKSRLKIWIFASVFAKTENRVYYQCMSTGTGRICFNNSGKSYSFCTVSMPSISIIIRDGATTIVVIYSMAHRTTIIFCELVNSFLYPIPCIGYWHNDFYSVSLHMHVNIPIQSFNSPTDGVLCKMQWHFIVLLFRFCLNMER